VTELNSRQREAIEHGDGPLMVLAGAGTGKTRVLVHRISRLVELGIQPWEILAVTFTNKAADEMRSRLGGVLGEAAEAMWIGTFHAICARILRRWGPQIGLERGFAIFDEADQVKIIERISRAAEIDEGISARAIAARIDRAKNRGIDPTEPTGHLDDAVARVYPEYQDRLARENAVDFNDLILKTLLLFDCEPAASALRTKFRHVLVDEFQDTNRVQYQLVWRLSESTRNLTVVGDDDQSIYAWRGAEPRNLLDFDVDFPDARVVKLEQNYRSNQTILDAANRVIARNVARHDKSLWTEQGHGHPIEAFRSFDDRGEAGFVAAAVRELVASSAIKASDVAVMYRTNAQSRALEEQLRAARIPVRIAGGASFFERREIRDLVAYLRLLVNPRADSAFERVINVPARGLGEKTVERVRGISHMQELTMLEAARYAAEGAPGASGIGPTQRARLREFVEMIDRLRALVTAGTSVAEMIVHVMERSGLRAKLEGDRDVESTERLENLAELITMAVDFRDEVEARARSATTRRGGEEERGDAAASLPTFLERIALSTGEDDPPGASKDRSTESVVLTTIHVAKGLEWPVVFLTGMEDGLFPSLRPRDDASEESALEEERRLAYVAITRARDRLILSFARTRRVWGEIRLQEPSRFLADATDGRPFIDVD
jgi:DNA helicase II / ATP-dependent DNA helicase PcrA